MDTYNIPGQLKVWILAISLSVLLLFGYVRWYRFSGFIMKNADGEFAVKPELTPGYVLTFEPGLLGPDMKQIAVARFIIDNQTFIHSENLDSCIELKSPEQLEIFGFHVYKEIAGEIEWHSYYLDNSGYEWNFMWSDQQFGHFRGKG